MKRRFFIFLFLASTFFLTATMHDTNACPYSNKTYEFLDYAKKAKKIVGASMIMFGIPFLASALFHTLNDTPQDQAVQMFPYVSTNTSFGIGISTTVLGLLMIQPPPRPIFPEEDKE